MRGIKLLEASKDFYILVTMVTLVICMNITIRELDGEVYREFRAEALKLGLKVGDAMTQALDYWLKHRQQKKARRSLLDFKAYDWGEGTENASREIDETLYGWKK